MEHDEWNVKIVYTSDTYTEHIYKCDDPFEYMNNFMLYLKDPQNTIDGYVEDSINSEVLRFSKTRKISENEKNEHLRKMSFSNI